MRYPIYYSDGGVPKEGLSPTMDIYIKLADGTSAGTAPTISEHSGGFYYFDATPAERILCRIDSNDVSMSDSDRYIPLEIGPSDDTFDSIDEATVGSNPTTMKGKMQAIFNYFFAKRRLTSSVMTMYEKDDITTMKAFDIVDTDTETTKTPQ